MEKNIKKSVFCVTGASGFIGKHLVRALVTRGEVLVRALSRNLDTTDFVHPDVTAIQGDLWKPATLASFLMPGCTVINLAYRFSATSAENLVTAKNLIDVCRENKIKRLIHCSTAAVFGGNREDVVNERASCNPSTEYGVTKLLIEQILHEGSRGHCEYVNLRPTSVFGPGSTTLSELIANLRQGSMVLNYLRACLLGSRKTNLVNLDTVIAAIMFLAESDQEKLDGETFIISDDHEPDNNYQFVERYLLNRLMAKDYAIPPLVVPHAALSLLLRALGRDSVNPRRIFDSSKIRRAGFCHKITLEDGLASFVKWHQAKAIQGHARTYEST